MQLRPRNDLNSWNSKEEKFIIRLSLKFVEIKNKVGTIVRSLPWVGRLSGENPSKQKPLPPYLYLFFISLSPLSHSQSCNWRHLLFCWFAIFLHDPCINWGSNHFLNSVVIWVNSNSRLIKILEFWENKVSLKTDSNHYFHNSSKHTNWSGITIHIFCDTITG